MSSTEVPYRILPALTDRNRPFWTAGRDGELRFLRCQDCGFWIHPPSPLCPVCLTKNVSYEAVSGKATVATFSVNHQRWMPGLEPPYVVAIVEMPEQDGLRLTTNIVGCAPEDVRIGMAVRVTFEVHDDEVWIPLFEPDPGVDGGVAS